LLYPAYKTEQANRIIIKRKKHLIKGFRPKVFLYNEYNIKKEAIKIIITTDLKEKPNIIIITGIIFNVLTVKKLVKDIYIKIRKTSNGILI